ncbi:lipopolysaccharide biosynthesis protein [Georgenia alba]|uniref:Lipopolysaccharide biosynthesis protein n=1 Tax=Georgenia alba TaxID=2233858 RepID=A0ABW2Q584_9MICO
MRGSVDTPRDVKSTAVRSTGWVVLEKWVGRTITMVVFVILGRVLAPEDFGVIALANVFVAVLTALIEQGFSRTVVQRARLSPVDIDTAFWTALGFAAVVYAALFFGAPLIASAYDEPQLTWLIRALGLSVVIMAGSSVPAALLERSFAFRALAVRQLSGNIAGGALAVGVAILGGGAWALVAQLLGTAVVASAVLWVRSDWRPRMAFSLASLKDMWAFGATALAGELILAVGRQTDNFVIGTFFGSTALGYYFMALRIVNIVAELVTGVFGKVSFTTFSRLQHDSAKVERAFRMVTLGTALSSLPVFAFLACAAPDLLTVVMGEKWADSGVILTILATGMAIGIVARYDRGVLLALNKPGPGFRMTFTRQGMGILLLFAAVPFGVGAVPWARSARQVLFWPMRFYSLKKHAGIAWPTYVKPFARVALPVALAAGATFAVRLMLGDMAALTRLLLLGVVFAASLAVLMLILARPLLREAVGVLNSTRKGPKPRD